MFIVYMLLCFSQAADKLRKVSAAIFACALALQVAGMPPKKANRAERGPVLDALEMANTLTREKKAGDALSALQTAYRLVRSSPSSGRLITAFTPNLVGALLHCCVRSADGGVLRQARDTVLALYEPQLSGSPAPELVLPFDERIATLAFRVLYESGVEKQFLIDRVRSVSAFLDSAPSGNSGTKRRMFSPVIDSCIRDGDPNLILQILRESQQRGLALRDQDFVGVLNACVTATRRGVLSATDAAAHARSAVRLFAKERPIVGGTVAQLLLKLIPEAKEVSHAALISTGVCEGCANAVRPFSFTDRESALADIVDCLVKPHLQKKLGDGSSECQTAFNRFVDFTREVDALQDVSAAIDGANVGFFGLSSWYGEAKLAQATAAGDDLRDQHPSSFSTAALKKAGLPTDVSPNFMIISAAVRELREANATGNVVVFLHERHLSCKSLNARNKSELERWPTDGVRVIATPNYVNDDFCWMYAAIKHDCRVISNDQMRDHHFGLIEQKEGKYQFLQWRASNQVKFSCRFDSGAPKATLYWPPKCAVWIRASSVPGSGFPAGYHIPFTKKEIVDDTGKIQPNSIPENSVLLAESPAEISSQVVRICDGWVCAPVGTEA